MLCFSLKFNDFKILKMKKYKYLQEEVIQKINLFILDIKDKADGNYSGKHKSSLIGKSLDFLQHREYSSGDDIKLIDWKIYGRRDKFFIKQYHQETNLETIFFIDCSSSMWYPKGETTKYEYANFICSYLSYILINQNDKVGIVKFDNKIRSILPSSSSENFYYKILEYLEDEIKGEHSNFGAVIRSILSLVKKRTLLIFISDLISNNVEEIINLLKIVASYGITIFVLHIVSFNEKFLEFNFDNVKFQDIEGRLPQINTNIQEIKKLYIKEFEKMIELYNKELNNKNMRYKTIYTFNPILENLKIILE